MRHARNVTRTLLILSDEGNNHSRYKESDIKRLVQEADTQLYAIGILPDELNGLRLLCEVTEMTGGRVFAVGNMNELLDIASKIGMELRNQYVLGYRSSNKARDARWRKIKIKLRTFEGVPSTLRMPVISSAGHPADTNLNTAKLPGDLPGGRHLDAQLEVACVN
jgi:Ca-activated chloride channel family protein